jgi:pimeloyl-ACP methyl ester carboxylesterase
MSTATATVSIPMAGALHGGILSIPKHRKGLVLFAHGSGSSRFSRRNQFVASALNQLGIATLLFDLLTEQEDRDHKNRFDIELLASRLEEASDWSKTARPEIAGISMGLFGASTGGAAALIAAANLPGEIKAVVSRGGRPDLAMDYLPSVIAPTLLIVGGYDEQVLQLNRMAFDQLRSIKALEIVPAATHLFDEPGTLERAAELAGVWFCRYLAVEEPPA